MQDFISKGEGRSRLLKSAIPADTTWAQALEMLRNGTFPIDLNGINADGVSQAGTPLAKATLLSDSSARLFGLDATATIDDLWPIIAAQAVSSIWVYAEAGSTVVATNGSVTYQGFPVDSAWVIRGASQGTWTVTATKGSDTASKTITITETGQYRVDLDYPRVYGAKWSFQSNTSKFTRTDAAADFADPVPYVLGATSYGSPFDHIYPWSGIKRVSDEDCGELVAIPKFWYKLSWEGSGDSAYFCIQISNVEADGFKLSPAHRARNGNELPRDVIYIGRYHCANSTYKSDSEELPAVSELRASFAGNIESIGDGVYMIDFLTVQTLWLLYLVEYANWDCKSVIGFGGTGEWQNGAATIPVVENGYTDAMPYHTGTMKNSAAETGAATQYRFIEGIWDNVATFIGACTSGSGYFRFGKNPAYGSATEYEMGPASGYASRVDSDTYISGIPDNTEFFITEYKSGDSGHYEIIEATQGAGATGATSFGGRGTTEYSVSLFSMSAEEDSNASAATLKFVGSRLIKLP